MLLLIINTKFPINHLHAPGINKDQGHKHIDGTLLGKPEAEFKAKEGKLIKSVNQQNTAAKRNRKPGCQ